MRDTVESLSPEHFDGKRFFNPDAPQVRGWPDVLKWKLTSRLQRAPRFVADVHPAKPPRSVEGERQPNSRIEDRSEFD